jgi:hypothetical protein
MKIISQFKDYYDYVANIYGGGDPKITYSRNRIGKVISEQGYTYIKDPEFQITESLNLLSGYRYIDKHYQDDIDTWLAVCGKIYPLVDVGQTTSCKYEILDPEKQSKIVVRFRRNEVTKIGVENSKIVQLSKIVGHPIFIIKNEYTQSRKRFVLIEGDYPKVDVLGLASIYPAEQLYQDLSYFIVNKMKDSPDMMPRTASSDKEKVVQHGFDVKQSFRHRK